jgi:hypothetical protein
MEYDDRTASRPSPRTSHATPGLSRGEALVSRIDEARGRVAEHGAVHAVLKVVHIEDRDRVVQDVLAEVRLPPQARIDRDTARGAPRILPVPPGVPVDNLQDVRTTVFDAQDAADHEIGQAVPGHMAVDDPVAAGA